MVAWTVPHAGGPIASPGVPTGLIGGLPAAVVAICVCVGSPDSIATGSSAVMIGFSPAAHQRDATEHGGVIVAGCLTVISGD